jgi:hypothetical protein
MPINMRLHFVDIKEHMGLMGWDRVRYSPFANICAGENNGEKYASKLRTRDSHIYTHNKYRLLH